jgi:beta-lactamase superfamily II metal-dependent hydrolase
MYEVDFRSVGTEGKSGDAIALRVFHQGRWIVVIVDGGFWDSGIELAKHVNQWYETDHVDLVISTHPDEDHINGLTPVLELLDVDELFIHRPLLHRTDVSSWCPDPIDDLLQVARRRGTAVTEPFTGVTRFGGLLTVVGPTQEYYETLLDEARLGAVQAAAASRGIGAAAGVALRKLANEVVEHLPIETLTDFGETTERNNSSVITLLTVGDQRLLLTGDAGIPALTNAADYMDTLSSWALPLTLFHAPHHGSRRNVGPTILDRLLGSSNGAARGEAVVSASLAAPKHPSPKVTNAILRRGYPVYTTEQAHVLFPDGRPMRQGWSTATPLPPMSEGSEEDD